MSVGLIEQWTRKDEDVKNNAEAVEYAESCNEANERSIEVQFCFENHYQRHYVA